MMAEGIRPAPRVSRAEESQAKTSYIWDNLMGWTNWEFENTLANSST